MVHWKIYLKKTIAHFLCIKPWSLSVQAVVSIAPTDYCHHFCFLLVTVGGVYPQIHFIPGINATLNTFSNITGNPLPTISCTSATNLPVAEERFSVSTKGQVVVTNPESVDTGVYSCQLSNEIGPGVGIEFELTEAGIAILPLV